MVRYHVYFYSINYGYTYNIEYINLLTLYLYIISDTIILHVLYLHSKAYLRHLLFYVYL